MGKVREVEAVTDLDISDAIIATEREIAGTAWDIEDTDPLDETGDRTLESMGEGLEGQHEHEDDEGAEGSEEQEGDEESEGEDQGEGETEGEDAAAKAAAAAKGPEGQQQEQPRGRVPSGVLREAQEQRRAVEAERDALKTEIETLKAQGGNKSEIEVLRGEIRALNQQIQQGVRQPPAATRQDPLQPAEVPDIFENPKGFVEHLQNGFKQQLDGVTRQMRETQVATSFELAEVRHKDAFPKAMDAIGKLNPQNPQDRQIVQGIYNSPNPGEALVSWHRRNETLARVGNNPDEFEARIREETRQTLLKDPEFRKQLIAELRGDAQTGDNGSPRHTTRLPPSVKRAPGASSNGERVDQSQSREDEQSVADAAWR
jgi:hypothetical protein